MNNIGWFIILILVIIRGIQLGYQDEQIAKINNSTIHRDNILDYFFHTND